MRWVWAGQRGDHLSSVLVASHPCTWGSRRYLAGGAAPGADRSLALDEHCSAATETSVYYQCYFILNSKHSTILDPMKKINFVPVKTRTIIYKDSNIFVFFCDFFLNIFLICKYIYYQNFISRFPEVLVYPAWLETT